MPISPSALAISGRIASGKTTLAQELVKVLGWKYVGLGDYVRHQAVLLDRPPSRETLQDLGRQMVISDPYGFCKGALQHFGWMSGTGVVIDGLRNVEVLENFRSLLYPLELFLVYCKIPDEIRKVRMNRREHRRGGEIVAIDRHPVESDNLGALPAVADLSVDTTQDTAQSANEVFDWLRQHQHH